MLHFEKSSKMGGKNLAKNEENHLLQFAFNTFLALISGHKNPISETRSITIYAYNFKELHIYRYVSVTVYPKENLISVNITFYNANSVASHYNLLTIFLDKKNMLIFLAQ